LNHISKDMALQICTEIRQENRGKWYTFARLQCWGCTTFSKDNPAKMCLSSQDGCNLVNKRYAQHSGTGE